MRILRRQLAYFTRQESVPEYNNKFYSTANNYKCFSAICTSSGPSQPEKVHIALKHL